MGAGVGVGAGVEVGGKGVAVDVGEGAGVVGAGRALGERTADAEAAPVGELVSVVAREGLGEDSIRDAAIVGVVVETGDNDGVAGAVLPQAVSSVTTSRATFRDSIRRTTFRFILISSPPNVPRILVARDAHRLGGTADLVASG